LCVVVKSDCGEAGKPSGRLAHSRDLVCGQPWWNEPVNQRGSEIQRQSIIKTVKS
jgi:hypothetical protein